MPNVSVKVKHYKVDVLMKLRETMTPKLSLTTTIACLLVTYVMMKTQTQKMMRFKKTVSVLAHPFLQLRN